MPPETEPLLLGIVDVDVKIDALAKLQTEMEAGTEVRTGPPWCQHTTY